ncbi:MAG TPA: ABC transporter substrate-binding protein, partial [Bradyrhizobium sp.]|nr:ABC transporter substrate-binding protein [Bradyrhizobium sp.]
MLFVADPVGVGLATSLAHPGGNLTGIAALVPGGFIGKALTVLRELLPQAKRVVALVNPSNEDYRLLFPRDAQPAAATLGFQLDAIEVRVAGEIPGAIATAKAGGAEALCIVGDPIFNSPPNRVPDLAAQAGLPSIYLFRELVQAGGLISYGSDLVALARRGAHYVDRKAPNRLSFLLSNPPNSCLPSISKRRNRLVSKSRRPFSPAPTRSLNRNAPLP